MPTVLSTMTTPYSGKPQYPSGDRMVIHEERLRGEGHESI